MHVLQFAVASDWQFPLVDASPPQLTALAPGSVDIAVFLQGLSVFCRGVDADTVFDVMDDTLCLLRDAGYTSWDSIRKVDLAELVLSSTRDWECVGESGTIDMVRLQRDYTRGVAGEDLFWAMYQGMDTVDGQSYYCAVAQAA